MKNIYKRFSDSKNAEKKKKNKVIYSLNYISERSIDFILGFFRNIFKYTWRFMIFLSVSILLGAVFLALIAGYLYFETVGEIPKLEDPNKIALPQDSVIYDVDKKKIGTITSQRRYIVSADEISEPAKQSIVAIEDERYFNHDGIDFTGMLRALYVNYQSWREGGRAIVQGASTLTQQYVKHVYLVPDRTVKRKLEEISLAVQLESNLSKQEILDRYLNVVYFGNGNYGIEAAAQYYFGKKAKDLNVPESAILASIINRPGKYDPTTEDGKVETFERAHLVFNKMYQLGYISREELLTYKNMDLNEVLNIKEPKRDIVQPYYYDFVMAELLKKYSKEEIYTGGWEIYTTLSIEKSKIMGNVISSKIGKGNPTAAMSDIDPKTGAINAFWGGFNYEKSNFNLSTQGRRQPGSSFKPFVYAVAFEEGLRETSRYSNATITLRGNDGKDWTVRSTSSASTLEQGLAYSDNAMVVRLMDEFGIDKTIELSKRVGITSELNRDMAIALGGLKYGVSTLEMASAYGTFANEGLFNPLYSVKEIKNFLGDEIYKHQANAQRAVNEEVAALMNKSLEGVVKYGTASNAISLKNQYDIAGKTGTTDDHADTWFVGYTPNLSVAVWIGHPDSRKPIGSINGQTAWGGTFTASIWNEYAKTVLSELKKETFNAPKGLVAVPILEENETINSLINKLLKRNLSYRIVEVIDHNNTENKVISISQEGALVPLGTVLEVTVNVHKYSVPDFIGLTPFDAISTVNTSKLNSLKIKFDFVIDDSITNSQDGTIIRQSIEKDSLVNKGAEILLTIQFKTPKPVEVIKEVDVPYIPEDSELAELNKKIEELNKQVEYLQEENKQLKNNSIQMLMPNFIGMDIILARTLATELGFSVTLRNPSGKVTLQSIPAGTVPLQKNLTLTGTSSSVQN